VIKKLSIALALLGLALGALYWGYRHYLLQSSEDPAFFEDAIVAFEAADQEDFPAAGGILFVGSSSIRFWDSLAQDMAPLPVLNRGFGGAHLSHVIHNVDRVVLPYRPRAIVLYAGDNDLSADTGKDVERVVADFRTLADRILAARPETEIYFLSIKPSTLRWARWPEMSRANAEIEELTRANPRLHYIDVATPLLDAKGEPRDDVFLFDGLHMNATGYAEWTAVVAPILHAAYPELARGS
jgi:lysophospholipase L1-like esterase